MRLAAIAVSLSLALPALAIEPGEDAPSETIRREFVRSYFRNGFHLLAAVPATRVRRLGSTGLVQEFTDAANPTGPNYALVKANTSDLVVEGVESVFQVLPRMFAYYSSVGANTAGYPTTDTNVCTFDPANSCQYQIFDRNHALFAYERTAADGQNFAVRDPLFSRWRALGIGQIGPAVAAEESVTAASGVTAAAQRFSQGAIYSITSGLLNGRVFSVRQPVYALYTEQNRHSGFLGLPTGDDAALANGRRRQNFEGGAIEYAAGSAPVLILPVTTISVSASAPVERLNLGESFVLTASLFAANGAALDGRVVSWTTSNGRVLAIEPSGASVTVRAVGGGSATITAFSEGRSSRALTYFVSAPCCQVGEGAPTAAVQQSFQDAVTRNRLTVRIPTPAPVRRTGAGFVQELASPDGTLRYLLARSDARPSTYVVAGAILVRYLALGGPAGALGYPVADATAAGRQLFEGGALAGDPVVTVTGPHLVRWAAQNYEGGTAGLPSSEAQPVLSFAATSASIQGFVRGLIAAPLTGPQAGRAFLVSGLILARYASLRGPAGAFGLPTGEEVSATGRRRQEFEGGTIEYTPGDSEAAASERPRRASIFANPSAVPAGSRVRIAAGGFETGATLRIAVSGRPDFVVRTETGAYAWEAFVPAGAPSALVTLRAADTERPSIAVGSYVVQAASETIVRINKVRGDLQTGLPGARLPLPLRIAVTDENGVPLPGLPVRFNPSPGARVEEAESFTDSRGEAQAWLRLPGAELPALATAEAGRQVVTFSARTQASTLSNFPRLMQPAAGQALLAVSASVVRYFQNRGDVASPNGPADTGVLNAFLRDFCVFNQSGGRICDGFAAAPGLSQRNVNPWRLGAFVGGSLNVAPSGIDPAGIRDRLAAGSPVILALALSADGTLLGSHFAAAIGVAPGGAILIHDPSPAFSRQSLDEYLSGFSAGGRGYRAAIQSAFMLRPETPSESGFVALSGTEPTSIDSPTGPCGFELSWHEPSGSRLSRFRYCDGTSGAGYQLDVLGAEAVFTSLAEPGTSVTLGAATASSWRIHRPAAQWEAAPQTAVLAPSVVNAASFAPGLSPGALAAAFGAGLARTGAQTAVEVDGVPARVLAATPFQINFEIPPETATGARSLKLRSAYGEAEQVLVLDPVSPASFQLGGGRGAVLNQNGSVNTPETPVRRGDVIVVYCTGLGETEPRGGLSVARLTVTASLAGRELATIFAGAAPGLPGVYQGNFRLPADLAPGLALELRLTAGGVQSGPVIIAVE